MLVSNPEIEETDENWQPLAKPEPIDDGGPAFPIPLNPGEFWNAEKNGNPNGISLRMWLAGMALANRNIEEHNGVDWAEKVAEQALRIADALIAKGKQKP